MSTLTKKEIKETVKVAVTQAMEKLSVTPSKKTRAAIKKVTKKISLDLKKQTKEALKESKSASKKLSKQLVAA